MAAPLGAVKGRENVSVSKIEVEWGVDIPCGSAPRARLGSRTVPRSGPRGDKKRTVRTSGCVEIDRKRTLDGPFFPTVLGKKMRQIRGGIFGDIPAEMSEMTIN